MRVLTIVQYFALLAWHDAGAALVSDEKHIHKVSVS